MFLTLQKWRGAERFSLRDTAVAAFARSRSGDGAPAGGAGPLYPGDLRGAGVRVIPLPEMVDVSSTDLRAMLARGGGSELLCPAVYGYILRRGLYGTDADLKHLSDAELRACSYSMVKAKRVNHIRGVEEEAVRLALRWGADPEKARKAGILHDCTKYLDLDEQLQLCAKYGIVLDELEQQAVKLLHSKTGAALAGRCSACRRTCVRLSTGIPPARGT